MPVKGVSDDHFNVGILPHTPLLLDVFPHGGEKAGEGLGFPARASAGSSGWVAPLTFMLARSSVRKIGSDTGESSCVLIMCSEFGNRCDKKGGIHEYLRGTGLLPRFMEGSM